MPLAPLTNDRSALQATLNRNGTLRHLRSDGVSINLFAATELEAGPANLLLRALDGEAGATPLFGPRAGGRAHCRDGRVWVEGRWSGLHYRAELVLAASARAWFWHVAVRNDDALPRRVDLVWRHDLGLAPWDALRLNEAYASQYIDHRPLAHPTHGVLVASRQNSPVHGRHPWVLSGSLRRAVGFATDSLEMPGLDPCAGDERHFTGALPSRRLQHEHSLVALQDEAFTLAPGECAQRGFFACYVADHPAASSEHDLQRLAGILALPERDWQPPSADEAAALPSAANLFSHAPAWASRSPSRAALEDWVGSGWREVETADADGGADAAPLSFFDEGGGHVVCRDKARAVLRPHGHLMRSGRHWTPDEGSITATVWMAGMFGGSLTQGHVSINRVLSAPRGWLGFHRAHGQRVFVDAGAGWRLLEQPSAWRCEPEGASWLYDDGLTALELHSTMDATTPEQTLALRVRGGGAVRVRVAHHVALDGDDGLVDRHPDWRLVDGGVELRPAPGSAMHARFPQGRIVLRAGATTPWSAVGGDELLFADGQSRAQPWLCVDFGPTREASLTWRCELIAADPGAIVADAGPQAAASALRLLGTSDGVPALDSLLPWMAHDALVHYLAPRGLEQFSGGGWGTRDVAQGPAELLLALGRHDVLRDLLCRLFSAQDPGGDWPQWFGFFARDAGVRAADSHGDIVYWPLAALADYLLASGDHALLALPLPYFGAEARPLADHVQRALAVIRGRRIAGTRLPAYGHGDWNDALQPADPAMRERLASAWTATLEFRTFNRLAEAWDACGGGAGATTLRAEAEALRAEAAALLADFQRLLVVDDVVAGYASFDDPAQPALMLHPRDGQTGIAFSALPMVHAIIDELFTPEQARSHRALIESRLTGPDGLRLFDRPLRYRGGTMERFQRGESASFFGREIGLMYMHAHLRWAEALAQLGDGEALFHALRQANPIEMPALVRAATRRQRNCWYSSSDARFDDREQASREYGRIDRGEVALEGGWRVYSSGPGIFYRLVVQRLLGLEARHDRLGVDPVLPRTLDGLRAVVPLYGHALAVHYRVGARGHGPLEVALDGVALACTAGHNRYRVPGIRLDAADLRARLDAGARELRITLG